ncbi:MAG: FtsH protease activity modulator HflK [Pseudomonadota bacterium]
MTEPQGSFDVKRWLRQNLPWLFKQRNNGSPESGDEQTPIALLASLIIAFLAIVWAASGIYIVQPAEQGVVLRFGRYVRTVNPGFHWYPRFIEKAIVVNVDQVNTVDLSQLMLTQEENIVSVSFVVQFKIGNLQQYLFNVVNPVNSLQQILDSAVRQEIGQSKLDQILTTGRAQISNKILKTMNQLIERYQLGIVIRDVTMQPATAPEAVKVAFDDVIKAREDRARFENEAQNYANSILPNARGQAMRIMQEANAYKERVVLQANGDVAKFLALLPIYNQAPKTTMQRMYLTTMAGVFKNSDLYVIDGGKGNQNLFYVPLDKAITPTQVKQEGKAQ